jgi:bisphosphoglycerate-independent phosphoglycerate mutase (AlkP superfamily)
MQAGWDLPAKENVTPRQELLNELYKTTTRFDDDCTFDSFLQPPLMDYVASGAPRVLFVGYGETDDWAHAGRYDNVLQSAQQFDRYVEQLWNTMQSMPAYRDQTTFILTTDHGRGSGRSQWKDHGVDQKGSENIWIAVLGPDTPGLGERANIAAVTQSQIAATVAAFVGKDYRAAVPAAAPVLPDVIAGDGGR